MDQVTVQNTQEVSPEILSRIVIHGDLSKLSEAQKVSYYKSLCDATGLSPVSQPFAYLKLNGREVLYATKAATDQLRKLHGVSVAITARENIGDVYVVTARASVGTRSDESTGAVSISNLKGDGLANALMKAETKAKRRVTLSLFGLGMLDETEVETIPNAQVREAKEVKAEAPVQAAVPAPAPAPSAEELERTALYQRIAKANWDRNALSEYSLKVFGVSSAKSMTMEQLKALVHVVSNSSAEDALKELETFDQADQAL